MADKVIRRLYLNGHQAITREGISVTPLAKGEELPEPTEIVFLQEKITLYRNFISSEDIDEEGNPRPFIQEAV